MYTLSNVYTFDNTIFAEIDVALINNLIESSDHIPPIDNEILVSTIMMRCGLLEPVYGEPPVIRVMVGYWWRSRAFDFYQMWRAMHLSYNPIENYNRFTDNKRKIDLKRDVIDDHQLSGSDKTETGGEDVQRLGGTDTTHLSGTDDVEHQVSAYNENFYQPKDKDTTSYGKQTATDYGQSNTTDYGGTSTITYGKGDTQTVDETENSTDEFHEHVHGNIGVTTTQQMIEQELAMRSRSVYDIIADEFEDKFCITLYSRF